MSEQIMRIVLMGKSGSGKSCLANTILGEPIFKQTNNSDSNIRLFKAHTKIINGRSISLVDMPGTFTVQMQSSRREQQCEMISCLTQCAPGPHAVLLVLSVEKFTKQEQAVVDQIKSQFGEEVLRFTTVVFTHGDQLPKDMSISEFVRENTGLTELVQACGGRCHVVDNKYWNEENPQEENPYRSNQFQVNEILGSIVKTFRENGKYFTNRLLLQVEQKIKTEQLRIFSGTVLSLEESRERAKVIVLEKYIEDAEKPESVYTYVKYAAVVAGMVGIVLVAPKVMGFVGQTDLCPPSPPPTAPPASVEDSPPPGNVLIMFKEAVKAIKSVMESFLTKLKDFK